MLRVVVLLILVVSLPTPLRAQTLDASDYWSRLSQTDALLTLAISQSGARQLDTQAQIDALWTGADQVRLDDASLLSLDMDWLTERLIYENDDELRLLQTRVQTLLSQNDSAALSAAPSGADALSALDDVLNDPRFQYSDATPTPLPTLVPYQPPPGPALPALPGELFSGLLFVVGAVAVAFVLVYLARGLKIPARKAKAAALIVDDDDPTTADAARERAGMAAQDDDLRAAIRYLYLETLLLLDERGALHYDKTLTNREHLRQIAHNPRLVEALRPVISVFERVWYGFAPVDETLYRDFVASVERLRQVVAS